MRKRIAIGISIAIFVIIGAINGCIGALGDSPADAVKYFYEAANAGDVEEALEYVDLGSISSPSEASISSMKGKIERVEILSERKGEELGVEVAEVVAEVHLKQGWKAWDSEKQTITLVKNGHTWKIALVMTEFIYGSNQDTAKNQYEEGESQAIDEDRPYYPSPEVISPPEETEGGILYYASNYPQNPKTPAEIVVTAIFLLYDGKFKDAWNFLGVEGLIEYPELTEAKIRSFEAELAGMRPLEFILVRDVSEEQIVIRFGVFTNPTRVWWRGTRLKEEYLPLLEKGNLFGDSEPYMLGQVVYTREVNKKRYAEFTGFTDEFELDRIYNIRATREYTKRNVEITLYFQGGEEKSYSQEVIKYGGTWKIGLDW